MTTEIRHRRGPAAEWATKNPILAAGEKGVDLDTGWFKLGNGVTPWNDLPYFKPGDSDSAFIEKVQDAVAGMMVEGTNVNFTYDDVNDEFVIDVAASGGDPEQIRDVIGAALVGVGLIGVTINDAGDTITISTTATQNQSDAVTNAAIAGKANTVHSHAWATDLTGIPANVSALAGLSGLADRLAYFTGAGAMALATLTSFARTLLSRASAAAMRTDLDVYSKAETSALMVTGSEMGYDENTSSTTSTNTNSASVAAGAKITGLSVTVVGEGRPVDIEWEGSFQDSVASATVGAYFIVNGALTGQPGAGYLGGIQLGSTTSTRKFSLKRRAVLAAGVSYTIEVGVYQAAAGTLTIIGTPAIPNWLAVTRR